MSIDLFEPANRDRASRVAQLTNDVFYLQQELVEAADFLATQQTAIQATFGQIAKKLGYTSADDMKAKVIAQFTADEKKAYTDLVATANALADASKVAFYSSTLVAVIGAAGSAALVKTFYIRYIATFHQHIGIMEMTAAEDIAIMYVKAEQKMAGLADTKLQSFLKVAQKIGHITMFVGVALDVVFAALAAYEAEKQKGELQDAIKKLYCQRYLMQMNKLLAEIATQGLVNIYGFLSMALVIPANDGSTVMSQLGNQVATDDLSDVTFAAAKALLTALDTAHGGAYTADDPSIASLADLTALCTSLGLDVPDSTSS